MSPKPPLVIASALLPAVLSGTATALGLGAMRTQSALNQPFYAEIEVNDVRADEIDAVNARLADREEFSKAGAERPHFLTRLEFNPAIGTDGRPYIQVSSREPIREPYIEFLVEVVWPQGTLVKHYTVLLDPPARGSSAPPRSVAPRTDAPRRRPPSAADAAPALRRSPPEQPPQAQPQSAQAPALPRPAPAAVPPQARGARFPIYYGPVPPGAALTRIARELTPPGATVQQTAMALFRNNQDAFMRANINRLRVGADLVVPTAEELFALDQASAQRQLQDAMAGRSVNTSPITDVPSDARLRIAAAEAAPPASAELPMAPPVAGPGLREDLLNLQATSESNRQETSELRSRILELESQLGDIQRLLALRTEQLAQLQNAAPLSPGSAVLPTPAAPADDGSAASPPGSAPVDGAAGQPFWVSALNGLSEGTRPWMLQTAAGAVLVGGFGLLAYLRRRRQAADDGVWEVELEPMPAASPSDADGPRADFARSAIDDAEMAPDTLPDLDSAVAPRAILSAERGSAVDQQTGPPMGVVTNLPPDQHELPEALLPDGAADTAVDDPLQDGVSSEVLTSPRQMPGDRWDEVSTKLDLARAFIEMEDPDAARSILDAVLLEGTDAQRADAQALLAQIG
jgi:FimV-like protein